MMHISKHAMKEGWPTHGSQAACGPWPGFMRLDLISHACGGWPFSKN